jgi:steroid 5-alpha reductase family enzyme
VSLPVLLLVLAVFLSVVMALAWTTALRTGKSGWIDAIWSLSVGSAGAFAALAAPVDGASQARQALVAVLVGGWSLRLGLHIAARTARGGDDPRYAVLRAQWGATFRARLFWFLQIQAACAFVLAVAVLAAAANPAPGLRWADLIGVTLLLMAVAGESVADRQMEAFRRNPVNKGGVCDRGLWGLSRHPNYFFEWLGWCAYPLIAIDPSGAYPWGWAALAAPALIYALLVHVSGIPPLEAHMLRSRGDAFRDYQARVSAFWPWPKRSVPPKGKRS